MAVLIFLIMCTSLSLESKDSSLVSVYKENDYMNCLDYWRNLYHFPRATDLTGLESLLINYSHILFQCHFFFSHFPPTPREKTLLLFARWVINIHLLSTDSKETISCQSSSKYTLITSTNMLLITPHTPPPPPISSGDGNISRHTVIDTDSH